MIITIISHISFPLVHVLQNIFSLLQISQQCNVTCNAWSFQREPPDPEPEEDFLLSADQTFKIHLITEFQFPHFTLHANSCPQQLFIYMLCYYCFHDVASVLLLFLWCCLTSSWLFFRPPQREEQRSSSQPNLVGYRFIKDRDYVLRALTILSWTRDKSEYEYTLVEDKWVNLTQAPLQSSA